MKWNNAKDTRKQSNVVHEFKCMWLHSGLATLGPLLASSTDKRNHDGNFHILEPA